MKTSKIILTLFLSAALIFQACNKDDDDPVVDPDNPDPDSGEKVEGIDTISKFKVAKMVITTENGATINGNHRHRKRKRRVEHHRYGTNPWARQLILEVVRQKALPPQTRRKVQNPRPAFQQRLEPSRQLPRRNRPDEHFCL